jgi:hypothetical protein
MKKSVAVRVHRGMGFALVSIDDRRKGQCVDAQ